MFLKSRMLTDKQQSVLRKALLLYISSSYRRHHQGQISKQVLADTLAEVDGISDLLHLKHVSE